MALRADRRQCQRPGLGNFDEPALPSDAGRGCALGGGLLEATSASAKKREGKHKRHKLKHMYKIVAVVWLKPFASSPRLRIRRSVRMAYADAAEVVKDVKSLSLIKSAISTR